MLYSSCKLHIAKRKSKLKSHKREEYEFFSFLSYSNFIIEAANNFSRSAKSLNHVFFFAAGYWSGNAQSKFMNSSLWSCQKWERKCRLDWINKMIGHFGQRELIRYFNCNVLNSSSEFMARSGPKNAKTGWVKIMEIQDVFYSPNTRISECVLGASAFCIECLMSLPPVIWQSCHIDASLLVALLSCCGGVFILTKLHRRLLPSLCLTW